MNRWMYVWLLGMLVVGGEASTNRVQQIVDDMMLPHEGKSHGIPASFDWVKGPRLSLGNDPGTFRAVLAWGQLYEAQGGHMAPNTRVQIRKIKLYFLNKKTGRWKLLQEVEKVGGAAYAESFADDVNRPADIREEPDGTISVTAGDGYNFHFWANGRVPIDPVLIEGFYSTVEARLIVNDPSLPDDRASARYLMSVGADYWLDLTAPWDQFKTNGDIGIGRFGFVTSQWESFHMHSLTEEQLRANPPPF